MQRARRSQPKNLGIRDIRHKIRKKVKLSLWRPISLWDVEVPTCGGEFDSLKPRRAFYPQDDTWYSFLLEDESIPGP
jgi:hypothetical protein